MGIFSNSHQMSKEGSNTTYLSRLQRKSLSKAYKCHFVYLYGVSHA